LRGVFNQEGKKASHTRPEAAHTRLSLRAHTVARYPYFEGSAGFLAAVT